MKLVLATNNIHKIREITEILSGLKVEIVTKDAYPDFPDVEETGATLEENAALKAAAIFDFTGLPSLADDSGLEVDAIGGEPGVNSARYAGPGCTFADNNRKLLSALEGIPDEKRSARFRCVIALCFGKNDLRFAEGRVNGRITTEIHGKQGFGYDPVFEIPHLGKTFAEMPAELKNSMSHRGKAVEKARRIIEDYLNK
ncbi:MAG: XTP/dITP diphosphatase [Candidatus Zixiibacteriota bacterium]